MSDIDKPKVELAQAIKHIRENWAANLEFIALQAQERRARYDALKREGFTDAQALELCKT